MKEFPPNTGGNDGEVFNQWMRQLRTDIPIEETIPIVEQAIQVATDKMENDIFNAQKRAEGCGCRGCFKDAEVIVEWYKPNP